TPARDREAPDPRPLPSAGGQRARPADRARPIREDDMSAAPLLSVEGLRKSYGAVHALRSASLEVRAGQAHALMGANGAGKSTFVKALTGVIARDAGTITMEGGPVELSSPAEGYRRGIAAVFQDPAMVPDLT